jgi:hypothetical protein
MPGEPSDPAPVNALYCENHILHPLLSRYGGTCYHHIKHRNSIDAGLVDVVSKLPPWLQGDATGAYEELVVSCRSLYNEMYLH